MEYSYWYLYLLEYSFFSTQLYSVLCENYEYKYSYLLEYWSKKPRTHEYFLNTAEYFFILKLFYSREIYIQVSKYLESFLNFNQPLSVLFAHNVSFSDLLMHIITFYSNYIWH